MNTQEKIEQRRQEAAKAKKVNQKRSQSPINDLFWKRLLGIVIAALIIVGIFALVFPQTGASRRMITAFKVNDEKVSVAEYSYYYTQAYSNYYQTLQEYLGEGNVPIDTTKSLKDQMMSEGVSYADYFSSSAMNTVRDLIAMEKEAEKENFELPAEYEESYETALNNVAQYAKMYDMTESKYLSTYFGMGFNHKLLEKCVRREVMAAAYQDAKTQEFDSSDEAKEAYYQEHMTDFDTADVRLVQFAAKEADEENGIEEVTALQAQADANAFLAKCTSEEAYSKAALEKAKAEAEDPETAADNSLVTNLVYGDAASLNSNVAEFIFNQEHKAGDVGIVTNTAETVFYVVYIVEPAQRNEVNSVDVRHILLQFDVTDEEAKAEYEQQINDIYDQFKAQGCTEEAFAALAEEFSQDSSYSNGGLYEDMIPGQTVQEFNDWCFDPERQVGDHGIVLTQYGYHLMYLSAFGEPAWKLEVADAMAETQYNEWKQSVVENYTLTTNPTGIALRDEPVA